MISRGPLYNRVTAAINKESLIERLRGIDNSIIRALFNPLPTTAAQDYQRQLQQRSTRVFTTIDEDGLTLYENDVSPLVSLGDITSKIMDALIQLLAVRDSTLAMSYHHRHRGDVNKQKVSTYIPRPRDLFVPTIYSLTDVISTYPDFSSTFDRLFKPINTGSRWYLVIVDIKNHEIWFVDPYPEEPSGTLDTIKQSYR